MPSLVIVPPFVPKGLYQVRNFASPTLFLEQFGTVTPQDDTDENQQWIISPNYQGGNHYDITNLNTRQALSVRLYADNGTNANPASEAPARWLIDTQLGAFVLGVADDVNERVVTLTSKQNESVLWPITGRAVQRWVLNTAIPGWIWSNAQIDTSKHYYIRNRASGRHWSYIGNGTTGRVAVDRGSFNANALYYKWILTVNPADKGIEIATAHSSRPKTMETMLSGPQGASFRFMPVPDAPGWYFIGAGLTSNPPLVATGREPEDDNARGPEPLSPGLDNQEQMYQLIVAP